MKKAILSYESRKDSDFPTENGALVPVTVLQSGPCVGDPG